MPQFQSKEIRFLSSILEGFFPFKLPASVAKKEDREHPAVFQIIPMLKKKKKKQKKKQSLSWN